MTKSTVTFSPTLSEEDKSVVAQTTLDILESVASETNNPLVTITSTLRPPERQAQAMFDNLRRGIKISYASAGRQVEKVYETENGLDKTDEEIVAAMTAKIVELSKLGQRVSRHCVSKEEYAKRNIVDVRKTMPNAVAFAKKLGNTAGVKRVISPYKVAGGNVTIIQYDPSEPAIHVEIEV